MSKVTLDDDRFVMIPKWIFYWNHQLFDNGHDYMVYLILLGCRDAYGIANLDYAKIAHDAMVSKRAAVSSVLRLEARGYIRVKREPKIPGAKWYQIENRYKVAEFDEFAGHLHPRFNPKWDDDIAEFFRGEWP